MFVVTKSGIFSIDNLFREKGGGTYEGPAKFPSSVYTYIHTLDSHKSADGDCEAGEALPETVELSNDSEMCSKATSVSSKQQRFSMHPP